ncbi:MAG: hypothetical protein ACKO00_06830 [Crocinitomicaceae bacterium]
MKFEFLFSNVHYNVHPNLISGKYLWIWKPNEVAPHVGFSISGSYFSLKVSGKELHVEAPKLFQLAIKKSTPLLLVELLIDCKLEDVSHIYESFDKSSNLNSSCLQPVAKLINAPSRKLTELLIQLEKRKRIEKTYTLNVAASEAGIIHYKLEDIEKKLISLQHVKRR